MPLESELRDGDAWVFDGPVADGFDEMLERSIPEYDRMREAVYAVASRFRPLGGTLPHVLDLGCSRGEAIAKLVEEGWTAVGYEMSEPMLEAARERYRNVAGVSIVRRDLRQGIPPLVPDRDVVLSVLTLMFVPTNYRQRILRDAYRSLRPGGALILVEKVLGHGELDETFVDAYHHLKGENGYSDDEIRRKALALEGVLVPLTAEWNEGMLRDVGFSPIDCFWAWLNFRAWVAVRS